MVRFDNDVQLLFFTTMSNLTCFDNRLNWKRHIEFVVTRKMNNTNDPVLVRSERNRCISAKTIIEIVVFYLQQRTSNSYK